MKWNINKIYPQLVKGKIRTIKNIINYIILFLFFFLPFLRFKREDLNISQAILFDLKNANVYFFHINFWPEEVYYLLAILIFSAIALFFFTSLFGRVWCGYSCPHTIWTDVFLKIETFFQGDRNERIKLDRKFLSLEFLIKKSFTHLCWILFSIATAITFSSYFNDVFIVLNQVIDFSFSKGIFITIVIVALLTYCMAGFAREKMCAHMCPYSRFQSVMFNNDSLIISYDEIRGEKRGKYNKNDNFSERGHCIDCKQCVVVCPVGIDIRDGLQMECISCGLCIDACNNIMKKVNLPPNLISYNSINKKEFSFKNYKVVSYAIILTTILFLGIFNLSNKNNTEFTIIPKRNPIFTILSNGDIRNSYIVKVGNKSYKDHEYKISLKEKDYKIKSNLERIIVDADDIRSFRIDVITKKENIIHSKNKINFILKDEKENLINFSSIFISP